jgi:hypothetical protein
MKWKTLARVVVGVVGTVVPAVAKAEQAAEALGRATSGPEKQQRALELVRESVGAIEGISERDLLNDADVERAARGVIDAVVGLQNIVAARARTKQPGDVAGVVPAGSTGE